MTENINPVEFVKKFNGGQYPNGVEYMGVTGFKKVISAIHIGQQIQLKLAGMDGAKRLHVSSPLRIKY